MQDAPFHLRTALLFLLVIARGGTYLLEQPASSMMRYYHRIEYVAARSKASRHNYTWKGRGHHLNRLMRRTFEECPGLAHCYISLMTCSWYAVFRQERLSNDISMKNIVLVHALCIHLRSILSAGGWACMDRQAPKGTGGSPTTPGLQH